MSGTHMAGWQIELKMLEDSIWSPTLHNCDQIGPSWDKYGRSSCDHVCLYTETFQILVADTLKKLQIQYKDMIYLTQFTLLKHNLPYWSTTKKEQLVETRFPYTLNNCMLQVQKTQRESEVCCTDLHTRSAGPIPEGIGWTDFYLWKCRFDILALVCARCPKQKTWVSIVRWTPITRTDFFSHPTELPRDNAVTFIFSRRHIYSIKDYLCVLLCNFPHCISSLCTGQTHATSGTDNSIALMFFLRYYTKLTRQQR